MTVDLDDEERGTPVESIMKMLAGGPSGMANQGQGVSEEELAEKFADLMEEHGGSEVSKATPGYWTGLRPEAVLPGGVRDAHTARPAARPGGLGEDNRLRGELVGKLKRCTLCRKVRWLPPPPLTNCL